MTGVSIHKDHEDDEIAEIGAGQPCYEIRVWLRNFLTILYSPIMKR